MELQGTLLKMTSKLSDVVQYSLPIGDTEIELNPLIGKKITLTYLNEIYCIGCGTKTYKSFSQGFCYNCLRNHPATDECIFNPEKCRAQDGISRNQEWAEKHCLQDHYVYLAVSSGLKVGVTRSTQIPTRWIDQGAWKAIKLALTPNRYTAGLIEVELKEHFADKTNWQRMLKNVVNTDVDLLEEKERAWEFLSPDLQQFVIEDDEITELTFPVNEYPKKVKSLSFDKIPVIEGTLTGIKGQYLIFDNINVLNIRKHGGYLVRVNC